MNRRKRLIVWCVGLILAGLGSATQAEQLKPSPALVTGKLKNGLTYYIYPNDYPKGEAVYRLFIKSGSVYEEEDQKGLAHFVEHMAFNGTRHFPGNGIIRFLESKGAKFGKDLNAHTSMNETVYKLQLPSNTTGIVDTTLTILADWAGGLTFDSLEIEDERGVILSEWLSKTGPEREIQNAFLMELLNHSRYAERQTIGDTAIIRHFPHERIKAYYRDWYHPSRMAVAVVGDVDVKEVERMIREKFSGLAKTLCKPSEEYPIEDYTDRRFTTIVHESLKKNELNMIRLLPLSQPVKKEKDYPLYLRRILLNRLFKARFNDLSFDHPVYSDGRISVSDFMNTKGVFLASVNLIPGRVEEGIRDFAMDMEQIFRYGFTTTEIEKAKKKYVSLIGRKAVSKKPVRSISIMDEVYHLFYKGDQIITPGEEYRLLQKYIGKIDSLALVEELKELWKPQETHYLLTAFKKGKDELPDENRFYDLLDEVERGEIKPYHVNYSVPESLLTEIPAGGKVVRRMPVGDIDGEWLELSNGVKVIYRPSVSEGKEIQLSGFRKGGYYALDSADYANGLFAASVIPLCGAGTFTREALSYYLAGSTVTARFLVDKTRTGIFAQAEAEDLETMFQLLYLKWTAPRMDTAVFRQTRDKTIEGYLTANRTEADRYYRDLGALLQGRSYVNRELSDTVIQQEVDPQRLLPVYRQCFGPAGDYTFVIITSVPLEELLPLICTYLGGLPGGKAKTDYCYKGPRIPLQAHDFIRNAGDSPKAQVSLIFQQDRIDGELRMTSLKNEMLQAVLRMKLLKELREELGMVYSVGVSAGTTLHPAPLSRQTIGFTCEPANTDLLIDRTLQCIGFMQARPDSFEAELKDVKINLIKEMKINIQKDSFWSGFIRNTLFNDGTDWDYIRNFEFIVDAVTTRDIAHMMKNTMGNSPLIKAILYPKDTK